jgi:hypothetical protein
MFLRASILLSSSLALFASGLLTKEKSISNEVTTALGYVVNNKLPSGAEILAMYSGLYPDVPMDTKIVGNDATFLGPTQEGVWGAYSR